MNIIHWLVATAILVATHVLIVRLGVIDWLVTFKFDPAYLWWLVSLLAGLWWGRWSHERFDSLRSASTLETVVSTGLYFISTISTASYLSFLMGGIFWFEGMIFPLCGSYFFLGFLAGGLISYFLELWRRGLVAAALTKLTNLVATSSGG